MTFSRAYLVLRMYSNMSANITDHACQQAITSAGSSCMAVLDVETYTDKLEN